MSHSAADLPPGLPGELSKFFRLLADETRLQIIVHLLRSGELNVGALCERLGQSQPSVSHHLALLRASDLIHLRREGKYNYYGLSKRRVVQLLETVFQRVDEEEAELRFAGLTLRRIAADVP